MGPRSRERRAGAVQNTNDSSALSKSSLAAHGYVQDAFAALLVPGCARRAPLIHRGYYVRARAVQHCVHAFLKRARAFPGLTRAQILCLGAGSDSLYFRLKSAGLLASAAVWEVDFPEVARRKAERIRDTPALCAVTGPVQTCVSASVLCLESSDYRILGLDLRQLQRLEEALHAAGLDATSPTLLLAEAVLTYLEPGHAAALVAWAARRFPSALFVTYEQMKPRDAFGQVMLQHFRQLNSPLYGLDLFPDVEAQRRRFLRAGWTACSALDLNEFYRCFIPTGERQRVEVLEPFDEFEEWHLKCAHYFILAASKGDTLSPTLLFPPSKAFLRIDPASPLGVFPARVVSRDSSCSSLKRYGHASVLLSSGIILSAGGFGDQEGRHCRVSNFHLLSRHCDLEWKGSQRSPLGTGGQWDGRLYHTMTRFSDSQVLVLGGRLSPVSAASGALHLHLDRGEENSPEELNVTVTKVALEEDSVLSCWRHSTTEVYCQNQKYLFVYGGRSVLEPVLSHCHFLHVGTMAWVRVAVEGEAPAARHSHSACSWQEGALIAGGLGASEEPLNSVFFLRPSSCGFLWQSVDIRPPITPRYSHTAHVVNGKLLLVGGVWIHSSSDPGVTVVDLTSGSSSEYQIDTRCVPWPLMLHNHTSILLPEEHRLLLLGGEFDPKAKHRASLTKCVEAKQCEENLGPQNFFLKYIVLPRPRIRVERFSNPATIMMEAEEQQQSWKTDFYMELPKVELHAHLNGSISSNTMKKLIAKKPDLKIHDEMTMIDKGKKRTLEECFEMFSIVHQLTTSPEDILMVTKDVIKEFADDGVKYLELRSTPRGSSSTGMTKKTYVESILEGIKQSKQENLDIDVRALFDLKHQKSDSSIIRAASLRILVPAHQDDDSNGDYLEFMVDYLPTAVENVDYDFISALIIFHKEFVDIWDVLGLVMERYPSFQDNCEKDQQAKRAITELLGIWMDRIPQDFCESPQSPAMLSQLKVYVTRNMPSSHLADRVQQLLSVLADEDECETDNIQEEEACGLDSVSTGCSELQAQDDTVGTPEALQVGPASLAVPTGDLPPKEKLWHLVNMEPPVTAPGDPAPVTMEPSEAVTVFQWSGTEESVSLPTAVGLEQPLSMVDSTEPPPAITADSPSGGQGARFEITSLGSYCDYPLPDVDV